VNLSVGGVVQHVRSRFPYSGVWHLDISIVTAAEFKLSETTLSVPCRSSVYFFLSCFVCFFLSLSLSPPSLSLPLSLFICTCFCQQKRGSVDLSLLDVRFVAVVKLRYWIHNQIANCSDNCLSHLIHAAHQAAPPPFPISSLAVYRVDQKVSHRVLAS